jgi:hypothetical protein
MFHGLVHSPEHRENEADVVVICRDAIIDRDCLADKCNGGLMVGALMRHKAKAIETFGVPRIYGKNGAETAFCFGEPAGGEMREG